MEIARRCGNGITGHAHGQVGGGVAPVAQLAVLVAAHRPQGSVGFHQQGVVKPSRYGYGTARHPHRPVGAGDAPVAQLAFVVQAPRFERRAGQAQKGGQADAQAAAQGGGDLIAAAVGDPERIHQQRAVGLADQLHPVFEPLIARAGIRGGDTQGGGLTEGDHTARRLDADTHRRQGDRQGGAQAGAAGHAGGNAGVSAGVVRGGADHRVAGVGGTADIDAVQLPLVSERPVTVRHIQAEGEGIVHGNDLVGQGSQLRHRTTHRQGIKGRGHGTEVAHDQADHIGRRTAVRVGSVAQRAIAVVAHGPERPILLHKEGLVLARRSSHHVAGHHAAHRMRVEVRGSQTQLSIAIFPGRPEGPTGFQHQGMIEPNDR